MGNDLVETHVSPTGDMRTVVRGIMGAVRSYSKLRRRLGRLRLYKTRPYDTRGIPDHDFEKEISQVSRGDIAEIEQILKYRDEILQMEKGEAWIKAALDGPIAENPEDVKDVTSRLLELTELKMNTMQKIDKILEAIRRDFSSKEQNMVRMTAEASRLSANLAINHSRNEMMERLKSKNITTEERLEQLSRKHGIPVDQIRQMMDNYANDE